MKLLIAILITALASCSVCPPATPENVRKWEDKHKFRASISDSCKHVRMLAMARKY